MVKHLKIKIFGLVQGVGFRYFVLNKARQNNIFGFCQNLPDGTVYLEAEGEHTNLDTFVSECKKGPFLAEVSRIEIKEGEIEVYQTFEIK